jgi:hypothetical protein
MKPHVIESIPIQLKAWLCASVSVLFHMFHNLFRKFWHESQKGRRLEAPASCVLLTVHY